KPLYSPVDHVWINQMMFYVHNYQSSVDNPATHFYSRDEVLNEDNNDSISTDNESVFDKFYTESGAAKNTANV
ncbi:MAG: hypothetical protein KAI17_12240, partial [Thiotrichaceae bacterium]|nr:hypothetical protein [Thiotrichaceae bacterium]